jgi:hypothetical protein
MKNDLLVKLIESREQLTPLKAIACRMAHERVLIDRRTQLPIAGMVPEIEFERVGLCDSAKRFKNPACSHTMARYPLENALNLLDKLGEYDEWRAELNNLNNTIHLLDHEKGELEKRSARIIKKIRETAQIEEDFLIEKQTSINEQIAEIESRHSVCAEKIERLKNDILAAVNSAIQAENKTTNE